MTTKNWYHSKTIVANSLALAAAFAAMSGFNLEITSTVQAEIVAGFMAIINIFLRFDTSTAIGKTDKPA